MKNSNLVILVVALLAAAFVAGGAWAAEKSPVKMVGTAILSGKIGAIKETGWGLSDGAKDVVQNKMLKDRDFVLILEDGQYEVPLSVNIFNRVLAAEPKNELLFHMGWQTGVLHSIAEKVAETHIVCVDGSMSTDLFTDEVQKKYPYYFSCGVTYGDQCGSLLKFIKSDLHKTQDKPKVAFIYIDAAAGQDPLTKLKEYAQKMDIDLVMVEPVTFETTDFAPTLIKIRNAKADYVILWSWSVPVSTRFIKAARKYLPKTEILGLNYMAWEIFFSTLEKDFDGVYVLSPYPRPSETKNPFVARLAAMAAKEGHEVKIWDLYLQGYLMSLMCAEGAKRADAAGNLTREGVRDALENLKNWDVFGMYDGKTVDFSTHKLPLARMLKADFNTKSFQPVTDWFLVEEYLK